MSRRNAMTWGGIVLAGAVVLAVVLSYCVRRGGRFQRLEVVRIGYLKIASSAPLYIALDKGLFEQEGLEVRVEEFSSSNLLVEAVSRGDVDAGVTYATLVNFASWQQSPGLFRIYEVAQVSEEQYVEAILVRPDSSIAGLADLRDRKIGAFPGLFIKTIMRELASRNGFEMKDSNYFELAPQAQLQALETGQVDALYALEPIITLATQQEIGRILVDCPPCLILDPMPTAVSTFSAEFTARRPEAARRVMAVFSRSLEYLADSSNEKEVRRVLAVYTDLPKPVADAVRLPQYRSLDSIDAHQLQILADILCDSGLLATPLDVEKMIMER